MQEAENWDWIDVVVISVNMLPDDGSIAPKNSGFISYNSLN